MYLLKELKMWPLKRQTVICFKILEKRNNDKKEEG